MIRLVILLAAALLAAGCDQNVGPAGTAPPSGAQAPARAPSSPPAGNSAAGITWTVPESWQTEPARTMRVATYRVPGAEGAEAGEVAVFFFGAGQGGDIDANLKRWIGQFDQPGGGSSERAARTGQRTVNGLQVTTVTVTGTYTAGGGPMAPGGEPKTGYKLIGAIVEAPEGAVFFKFTGPEKTVDGASRHFDELLQSVRRP